MSSDLHEIMHRLPHLSAAEMDQLYEHVKALRFSLGGVKPVSTTNDDVDLMLDVVARLMRSQGHGGVNATMLKRANGFASFKTKCTELMSFIRSSMPGSERVEQIAMVDIGISLLYHDMKNSGREISAVVLMHSIDRIRETFDRHFPGYAKCGQLKVLIRR